MVMDFSFLKTCMMDVIYDACDHGTILFKDDPLCATFLKVPADAPVGECIMDHSNLMEGMKLLLLPVVPTAENLAQFWHAKLVERIESFFRNRSENAPRLHCIEVAETPNCVATFPAV